MQYKVQNDSKVNKIELKQLDPTLSPEKTAGGKDKQMVCAYRMDVWRFQEAAPFQDNQEPKQKLLQPLD